MILIPSRLWESGDLKTLPRVIVHAYKDNQFLHVRFEVFEPEDCFADKMTADGENSWEDSCVEVFVRALDARDEYINFEFTSRGFCYAARGRNRTHRKAFNANAYSRILRTVTPPVFNDGSVRWELRVDIPDILLGAHGLDGEAIYGNLYKCGDRTKRPHYLSLFPVNTPKPDFHQPVFFKKIV